MANRFANVEADSPPKCPGCDNFVFPRERPVSALKAQWHPVILFNHNFNFQRDASSAQVARQP